MPLILSTKATSGPLQFFSKYFLCSIISSCFSSNCFARLLIKKDCASSVRDPTPAFALFVKLVAFSWVICLILQSFSILIFFRDAAVGYFTNTSNTQTGTPLLQ